LGFRGSYGLFVKAARPEIARNIPSHLKRFAKNLIHWFVEKRSDPIDGVGVSKSTCVST